MRARSSYSLLMVGCVALVSGCANSNESRVIAGATAHAATAHDVSAPLAKLAADARANTSPQPSNDEEEADEPRREGRLAPERAEEAEESVAQEGATISLPVPQGAAAVEQRTHGAKAPAPLLVRFDGIGEGFTGPHGSAVLRNPSDNTLAVGPNHVVQIVNTRMAIFTKQGRMFDTTGRTLYGPVNTNTVFKGFGGTCEQRNNGDAVVRYDQLADRWLIVMPIFTRSAPRDVEPPAGRAGEPARRSEPGRPGQPGAAAKLDQPPPTPPETTATATASGAGRAGRGAQPPAGPQGSYAMCYAISTSPDPFGTY